MRRAYSSIFEFVRETLPVLFFAALVEIIAGIWLYTNLPTIAAFAGALILLPALNNIRGSIAASAASQLASHYNIGLINIHHAHLSKQKEITTNFNTRRILTIFLCTATGVGAFLLSGKIELTHLFTLIGIAVSIGLVTGEILNFLLLQLLQFAHKRHLNPDNVLIPPIMALGDLLTMVGLLLLVQLIGGV